MTYGRFLGYSDISNLNPQTRYFDKKVNFQLFKKCCFWGCDVENWVWAKLALWICPILWIRVKIGYTQLSLTFSLISADPVDLSNIKKNLFLEKIPSGVFELTSPPLLTSLPLIFLRRRRRRKIFIRFCKEKSRMTNFSPPYFSRKSLRRGGEVSSNTPDPYGCSFLEI